MSTETYAVRIEAREGRRLELELELGPDEARVALTRTFWLAVLAEGILDQQLAGALAEEIDADEVCMESDSSGDGEELAGRFIEAVSVGAAHDGSIVEQTERWVRLEPSGTKRPRLRVTLELTEPRWGEHLSVGAHWSGTTFDHGLDGPLPAAKVRPSEGDHPYDDEASFVRDRALAVQAHLHREVAQLGWARALARPELAQAYVLSSWWQRKSELWPTRPSNEPKASALPSLFHSLGEPNIGHVVKVLEELRSRFAEQDKYSRLPKALGAAVELEKLLGDPERSAFFASPIGTPSPLALRLNQVSPSYELLSDDLFAAMMTLYFGRASTLVEEALGRPFTPVYWTWSALRTRLETNAAQTVKEGIGHGQSILHSLVEETDRQIPKLVKLALEGGANPNAFDHRGETPLHRLLRTARSSVHDQYEAKAFDVAAVMATLIEFGADPQLARWDGRTAQHLVAAHLRFDAEVAAALDALGVSWSARDVRGVTPLHDAGSRAAVEFLLERGTSIEDQAALGVTPLGMAVAACRCEAAIALIDRGAKIAVDDAFGTPVLHQVVRAWAGSLELDAKHGKFPDLYARLLAAGADRSQRFVWPGAPKGESLEQAVKRESTKSGTWKTMMAKLQGLAAKSPARTRPKKATAQKEKKKAPRKGKVSAAKKKTRR